MGKKRSKTVNTNKRLAPVGNESADSEELESIYSDYDINSVASNENAPDANEISNFDSLREKLSEALTLLESRTTNDREKSLNYIASVLKTNFVPDLLDNWHETLSHLCLKCLSKGKRAEARLSSVVLTLMFVQMGPEKMSNSAEEIRRGLVDASNNVSHSMELRGSFLYMLSICSFFNLDTQLDEELLSNLETIICGTMRKEVVPLVASAFQAWSVMAIQFKPERVLRNSEKLLFRILKIFEEFQDNKDLRLSAGTMVALIYELMNEPGERGYKKFQKFDELYDLLSDLSRQSGKVVGKKDKKVQKSSLREALLFMDGDCFKSEVIKHGNECFSLESYSKYVLYELFKELLGTGINVHLSANPFLRDVFDLGEVSIQSLGNNVNRKEMKDREKGIFASNDRARTVHLKKQRDKRSDRGGFD